VLANVELAENIAKLPRFGLIIVVGQHLKKSRLAPSPWSEKHVFELRGFIKLFDVHRFVDDKTTRYGEEMLEMSVAGKYRKSIFLNRMHEIEESGRRDGKNAL